MLSLLIRQKRRSCIRRRLVAVKFMNQMYRVKFTRNGDGTVESGEAIVNVVNQEQAIALVAMQCALPMSGTQFDCSRVKPAFVLIRRANVERHISAFEAMTVSESLASNAT